MKDGLNHPVLTDAFDEVEFFERERTGRFYVELAIVLYNSGVGLRKTQRVLGWLGVERSHVAIWKWTVRFGDRRAATGWRLVAALPSRILLDETVLRQRGEEFVLFAALAPETREVLHLSVYPSKSYLTTRLFFAELEQLYGVLPRTVITDGAREYGAAGRGLRIRHVVIRHGIRIGSSAGSRS